MKSIKEEKNLKGKKILLRLDLNVPLRDGTVLNDFRIKKIIPTLNFLQEKGAKIIILGHIGRKKEESLFPVFNYLKSFFKDMVFCDDVLGGEAKKIVDNLGEGEIVLMENLRKYDEEKNNDISFSKQIARLGDLYVNEAFSNSHRKHSSIVGIPQFLPSYSGILFEEEVKNLSRCFEPQESSLFIIGGNKLKTKLSFIKNVLEKDFSIFVGGALANNFFKEEGLEVGKSFVVDEFLNLKELVNNKKLILPIDVVVGNQKGDKIEKELRDVLKDESILDVGQKSVLLLEKEIEKANFVLMNGTLGDYKKGFSEATNQIIEKIASLKKDSFIGGGDTTFFINKKGIEKDFTFVSTAGGAMLEFIQKKTLPGIEALK